MIARRSALIVAAIVLLWAVLPLWAEEGAVFDVPRMDAIAVDGDAQDWGQLGFRIEVMLPEDGKPYPLADRDSTFQLAWDERGLLVLGVISDDTFTEAADANKLPDGDSIEVVVAASKGAKERYRVAVSPGLAADQPALRGMAADFTKKDSNVVPAYEAVRARNATGYTVEMLLPWINLNLNPAEGLELAVQLTVNDVDGDEARVQTLWFPAPRAHDNTMATQRIRLAKRPSAPYVARVTGDFDDSARSRVRVVAIGSLAGETAVVRMGRHRAAEGMLVESGGFATSELFFDMPEPGAGAVTLDVRAGKTVLGTVVLPDADVVRAQRVMLIPMALKPPVFRSESFPEAAFTQPLVAERLLGKCTLKTAYYDRDYNPVAIAVEPGRYGAIVEVSPEFGRTFRRYFTLFRAPVAYKGFLQWWFERKGATLDLPPAFGIPDTVQEAQRDSIGRLVGYQLAEGIDADHDTAVLLAGLFESKPDMPPATVATDVWAADRQWWVGLKRKLNGMEAAHPNAFVCPYPKEGNPAPTLRAGTPEEAGMKPDVVEKIDGVLNEWATASSEPFAVCLARKGVVFFQKAYGERDGQPMTLETKSWMASISKFLSGVLMMELVDQGLVDLDAPIDRYIPALRGIDVETPLTVRHLYVHTNGLQLGIKPPRMYPDHWGDDMNDFEEVIAGYYPRLEVGTRHAYNGVGYAMAGKVMESLTGEALPQLFMNHLWGPLGCTHTDAVDASARTFSTAPDIAIFGQMLLNKGAYGNLRYMKEETFEKLLPVKLAPYVKFETDIEWGIGCVYMPEPGLSPKTFGHGAASSAILKIDPEHELVIVMTRNTAGPQYGDYQPKFVQAIVEGMQE
ncbi:MAG: serine hydrolase [Candidatus Hydrogenedentes bacterium]|nr:serine hydrolase [Candidatus Hydrogenedentota bacterium]